MVALAVPFGLVIGLIVGAVGGGGAILALPVLVYVLGQPVGPASAASLIVVALAAAVGAGELARRGHVCWRVAVTFSIPAAGGSLIGALVNKELDGRVLILAFVPVMLIAAGATWQRAGATREHGKGCPDAPLAQILGAGFLAGVLTGLFGVGGGFVIVPVLTLGFGADFRHAVATSLVIITLTGGAALASHLLAGARVNVPITASLAGATAVGALLGTLVGGRLPQRMLGRGFALVVTAVAVFLLADVVVLGGPPGA